MHKKLADFLQGIPLAVLVAGLLLLCGGALVLGLRLGFVELAWQDILQVLLYHTAGLGSPPEGHVTNIIWQLRLPRLVLSLCVGMGLTLSGLVMQAVVQNPLADPYILGISSGASFGAVLGIFLGLGSLLGPQTIGFCAFGGAVGVAAVVVLMARRSSRQNAVQLLLTGMAMSAVCSSLAGLIVFLGQNKEGMEAVTFWLMGSTANARLEHALLLLGLVTVLTVYFSRQSRVLNLLLLGPDAAMTLGWDLKPVIRRYLLLNGLLVGFMVFNAGAIGFVGLVIPHMARSLVGSHHRRLLPVAVLAGGLIAVLLDILSRTAVRGIEIPLGVIFALIGAPCFIYLMVQRKYRFGG